MWNGLVGTQPSIEGGKRGFGTYFRRGVVARRESIIGGVSVLRSVLREICHGFLMRDLKGLFGIWAGGRR